MKEKQFNKDVAFVHRSVSEKGKMVSRVGLAFVSRRMSSVVEWGSSVPGKGTGGSFFLPKPKISTKNAQIHNDNNGRERKKINYEHDLGFDKCHILTRMYKRNKSKNVLRKLFLRVYVFFFRFVLRRVTRVFFFLRRHTIHRKWYCSKVM